MVDKIEYLEGNKGILRIEYRKSYMRGISIYIFIDIFENGSEYI